MSDETVQHTFPRLETWGLKSSGPYGLRYGGELKLGFNVPADGMESVDKLLQAMHDGAAVTVSVEPPPFEPDYYRVCRGAPGVHYSAKWFDKPPWRGVNGYTAYTDPKDWERVKVVPA